MGLSEDPVQIIEQAAKEHIKDIISKEAVETLVDRISVYEVRGLSYSPPGPFPTSRNQRVCIKKHKKMPEQMASLVTPFITGTPLKKISSANLTVECGEFSFAIRCTRC